MVTLFPLAVGLHAAPTTNSHLTVSDVTVTHTNKNEVQVTARISSADPAIKAWSVEYFLDSTNGVVIGRGEPMSPVDGRFDSTNEVVRARFTPSFSQGRPRDVFIHARGTDLKWTPFVKTIITPSVDEILDKIRKNYGPLGGR
jgi:hypothetical protein